MIITSKPYDNGSTVFSIKFAVVVARLIKAVALWKCEKGSSLGLLAQCVGSQILATIVAFSFVLRRFEIGGTLIVLLWLLSPLGGQLSSRVLTTTDLESKVSKL